MKHITAPNDAAHGVTSEMLDNSEIGLTKREYFAAAIMAAAITNAPHGALLSDLATSAVVGADALIDALNAPKGDQ